MKAKTNKVFVMLWLYLLLCLNWTIYCESSVFFFLSNIFIHFCLDLQLGSVCILFFVLWFFSFFSFVICYFLIIYMRNFCFSFHHPISPFYSTFWSQIFKALNFVKKPFRRRYETFGILQKNVCLLNWFLIHFL